MWLSAPLLSQRVSAAYVFGPSTTCGQGVHREYTSVPQCAVVCLCHSALPCMSARRHLSGDLQLGGHGWACVNNACPPCCNMQDSVWRTDFIVHQPAGFRHKHRKGLQKLPGHILCRCNTLMAATQLDSQALVCSAQAGRAEQGISCPQAHAVLIRSADQGDSTPQTPTTAVAAALLHPILC